MIAEGRDLTLFTAENRRYEQSPAVALRTEGQKIAFRRPIRLPVVSLGSCHANRIALADRPHPDVEIAAPIGAVSDHASVGRPTRFAFEPGIEGQLPEFALLWR